jgi:hypothetical protein
MLNRQKPRSPTFKTRCHRNYLITMILASIFILFGEEIFKLIAVKSWFNLSFAILACGLERSPKRYEKCSKNEIFVKLCRKALKPSHGARLRHLTWLYNADDRTLTKLKNVGCSNEDCGYRELLMGLSKELRGWEKSYMGERVMADLWGSNMKLCVG